MYIYLFEYSYAGVTSGCSSLLCSLTFLLRWLASLRKAWRRVNKRIKTKAMIARMILERTVMMEIKREPPMTIQISPMTRAEKVLRPFKRRKGRKGETFPKE